MRDEYADDKELSDENWKDPITDDIEFGKEPTLITERLLREVSGESDLAKTVTLDLHDRNIHQIQKLELCAPNLRTVDLSFNQLVKLEGLTSLSKLKELKLYDNRITSLGTSLQPLTALHTLDLTSNRLVELQGINHLRSLKVLKLAYNQISNLECLGRVTQLEMLDLSSNKLKDLTGLSSCINLRELYVNANQISNLKGIQRCSYLYELHASDNALTTLQGLKTAAPKLDILNVSGNKLSNLDSLADNCVVLSELYVADNNIEMLSASLATKAPNLDSLDIAGNNISDLDVLTKALKSLPELSSLRLEGNPLPEGYAQSLFEALPELDKVDVEERLPPPPPANAAADVWVNPEHEGVSTEGKEDGDDASDVWVNPEHEGVSPEEKEDGDVRDSQQFMPTISEMEAFKRKMGIVSDLPIMGRVGTPMGRPQTGSSRPGSASRPPSGHALRSSLMGAGALRPGSSSARPGSATRPGSASTALMGGKPVKDIMMHQRPPSARTGGSAKLMDPQTYHKAVADFKDTMDGYSAQLRGVLTRIRHDLSLDISEAAAQMKTDGVDQHKLPAIPNMPELPKEMRMSKPASSSGKPASSSGKPTSSSGKPASSSGKPASHNGRLASSGGQPTTPGSPGAPSATSASSSAPSAAELMARRNLPVADTAEVDAALQMYRRLFPDQDPSTAKSFAAEGGAADVAEAELAAASTSNGVAGSRLGLMPPRSPPLAGGIGGAGTPSRDLGHRDLLIIGDDRDEDEDDRDVIICGGDGSDDEEPGLGPCAPVIDMPAQQESPAQPTASLVGASALVVRPGTPSSRVASVAPSPSAAAAASPKGGAPFGGPRTTHLLKPRLGGPAASKAAAAAAAATPGAKTGVGSAMRLTPSPDSPRAQRSITGLASGRRLCDLALSTSAASRSIDAAWTSTFDKAAFNKQHRLSLQHISLISIDSQRSNTPAQ
eukprot:gene7398-525_t